MDGRNVGEGKRSEENDVDHDTFWVLAPLLSSDRLPSALRMQNSSHGLRGVETPSSAGHGATNPGGLY
ncbi:hypothetical protein J2T11_003634 [Paenarthrobacter nicotinovorans]|nr:hypothetical protein [Paenarthrobacter nicotinovorans]